MSEHAARAYKHLLEGHTGADPINAEIFLFHPASGMGNHDFSPLATLILRNFPFNTLNHVVNPASVTFYLSQSVGAYRLHVRPGDPYVDTFTGSDHRARNALAMLYPGRASGDIVSQSTMPYLGLSAEGDQSGPKNRPEILIGMYKAGVPISRDGSSDDNGKTISGNVMGYDWARVLNGLYEAATSVETPSGGPALRLLVTNGVPVEEGPGSF